MTSTFLKRKSFEWFRGKKAKVLVKQYNIAQEVIDKDEEVIILSKSKDQISLDIQSSSGVIIYGVWCEQLELI